MTSIVKIDLQVLNSGVNQSVNELEEVGAKDDGDLPVHFSRSLVATQGRADFAPTQKGK
jgi:hypothetical protein|tara:strand:- start:1665 stop:1841 length:177 start_codon:yes stop_codon:yes gene_type:complete